MNVTIVVGGGAAGLISAYFSAKNGDKVVLIEKNEKLGKKLYITGKGRCNVTNDCDEREFLENVVTNPKFLTSAVYKFPPSEFYKFLNEKVPLKIERGNRVFPLSDKASDITACLEKYCKQAGVEIKLNEKVLKINATNGKITGVTTDKSEYKANRVIVCTGGLSYPSTGSTGDGYKFAADLGIAVVPPVAALCGFNLKGEDFKPLQGISLKNVSFTAEFNGKVVYTAFGEALFTHFGISGPIVISASSYLNRKDLKSVVFTLDLKPALTEEQLDARILRDFEKFKGRAVKNSLDDLLLKAFIPLALKAAGISGEIKNSTLSREDRKKLVHTIKNLKFYPASLRGVSEAIVTSGGVSVKEINPSTMESKKIKGLYFAGEVLDIDALTGGFNITAAACTAFVAGSSTEE
ncbi:MAG: NAD(P)/FAD-dependent oxidoreductase [Clostridia bacterium]|nr:NAD(P)/FAD-dependent oxidoreductase [Clostridia bacterium]